MAGPRRTTPDADPEPLLPAEVEIIIDPDGAVTFADLEAGLLAVARELNPDQPMVCDVPPASDAGASARSDPDAEPGR
jgi:hypothetical protein